MKTRIFNFSFYAYIAIATCLQAGRLDELVEAFTKVPGKVEARPLKDLDNLYQTTLKKRGIEMPGGHSGHKAVMRELSSKMGINDPVVLKALDDLPPGDQGKFAAIFMDGAQTVRTGVPDIANRSLLLADDSGDILVASSRIGDDFPRESFALRKAFDAGTINRIAPNGKPSGTYRDFNRLMASEKGKDYWKYWQHIRGNWKKYAAGGFVAWFLADPDGFAEAQGLLAERVVGGVTKTTGKIIEGAGTGLVKDKTHTIGFVALGITGYLLLALRLRLPPFRKGLSGLLGKGNSSNS